MKRYLIVAIFLLLSINSATAVTDRPFSDINRLAIFDTNEKDFSFAVFGDFRTARRDNPYHQAFEHIIEELKLIAPHFIISTGDAYYGYGGSMQRFKNEIDYFVSKTKNLPSPFFNIIGNHELGGTAEREKLVKERFGNFYGSFDFGGSHFIALNTEETAKEGTISGEQLSWLEKDLESNKTAANIFVFLHRPLFSAVDPLLMSGKSFKDKTNRENLHNLFRRYKVKVVFAGHEHLFDDTSKDGVRYIITGGGGAPLYQAPNKGGFFHYLIVKVKGADVGLEILAPNSLQKKTVSGNNGFEAKGEIELLNISHAALQIRNLYFLMPAADAGKFKAKAFSTSKKGEQKEVPARIYKVKNNGDGTSTVSVEVELPANGSLRVVVETDI
ncbi:MAG: metallophosphoesterase [Nitrospirae bacterium]|nr:metallophosphoesterase [Nitrospirota bacterium]